MKFNWKKLVLVAGVVVLVFTMFGGVAFAGEKELAQFCGTWPLGDRIKGAGDLAEKLIDNLLNKGQLVPEKPKEIKIPKELYPSINDKEKISN